MECNTQYKEQSYWDKRFAVEKHYEWLADFTTLQNLIVPILLENDRILILGCGNSRLGFDLYDCGYRHVTCLDFAAGLIDKLASESAQRYPEMDFICADIRDMRTIPNGDFDVVIEKATLDSLLVAEKDPWHLSDTGSQDLKQTLTEVSRILKDNGTFISITFGQPHFRVPQVAKPEYNWNLDVKTFGNDFHYFFYTMKKRRQPDLEKLERYFYPSKVTNFTARLLPLASDNEEFLWDIAV